MIEVVTRDQDSSPFHRGEQDVQEKLGVRDIELWARKVVRSYLPEQHRDFHTSLPFLVVAARDEKGRPWATLLDGPDGFVSSPDPQSLTIEAAPAPGDALERSFRAGTDIGILGIELATRRRNRVNGHITAAGSGIITFRVDQAFGNCPQYIRERAWRRVDDAPAGKPLKGTRLTASQRAWIKSADTFFIASGYRGGGESPTFGMDASHRGGDGGFVQVLSDGRRSSQTMPATITSTQSATLSSIRGLGISLSILRAAACFNSQAQPRLTGSRRR